MFTQSGKASIAYGVHGSDDSVVDVLLLHAGVTDRRSWRPLVDALGTGRRFISFDARGYGETTYQPEDHHQHDDAIAVLDAVGLESAVVIGASMGGKAAINLALEHPERVQALILIGPAVAGAPAMEEDPEPIARLGQLMEAAEVSGDLAELNRLEAHLWLDGPTADEGRVDGAARALFLEMNGQALAARDPGKPPAPLDAWSRLEELTVPVLALIGDLDVPDIRNNCEGIAERVPDARLVVLDGVAHLPHLEGDPRCFAEIDRFLRVLPDVAQDD
jgi:pimeloyl-ACP methyl ester carboxylesterase